MRAATAALRGEEVERAVALLERGRALMTSEAIEQARVDLDALDAAGAHELRLRVEAAGRESPWSELAQIACRTSRIATAVDLRRLRDDIRAVPGFESFLAAPSFDDVAAAAAPNPLVYVTSGIDSGVALIVRGRSVTPVPLLELTEAAVRTRVAALLAAQEAYLATVTTGLPAGRKTWSRALLEVGEWLWAVAGDALAMELKEDSAATVVAGGLLGLLPLHAACRPDPMMRCSPTRSPNVLPERGATRSPRPHPA